MKVEHSDGIKAMTDEQLDEALEALRELLVQRAAEAEKVLEGTSKNSSRQVAANLTR
jgi:ribosomal protein L29